MSEARRIYRICSFDSVHNNLCSGLVEAEDDRSAIAAAEASALGAKCEVWEGSRLVAQVQERRRQA